MAIGSIASQALGLGTGSSGLEKLTIYYEEDEPLEWSGEIVALFNPSEFTLTSNVTWKARGGAAMGSTAVVEQEFREVTPRTLSIDLFFDTYESHADKLSLGHLKTAVLPTLSLFAAPEATSVKAHTDLIAQLAQVNQELHRPPICKLEWGRFQIFSGVLTNLTQKFTMFMPDGTPVRATCNCTFAEHHTEANYLGRELHSADVSKTHTVRPRETLHTIAAQRYNDPALWRHIARANKITNPRQVRPGTVLIIPTLS